MRLLTGVLAGLLLVAGIAGGCSAAGRDTIANSVDGSAAAGGRGSGGGANGGTNILFDGGPSDASDAALAITPVDPVVDITITDGVVTSTTVSGAAGALKFSATANGQPTDVTWSIDRGEIGTLDPATGAFTPAGNIAGKAQVTAQAGTVKASTTLTVRIHSIQNGKPAGETDPTGPAGVNGVGGEGRGGPLDAATKTRLTTGTVTKPDARTKFLYPYDGTVFPRGIPAPLLQWDTSKTIVGVYIRLSETNFDYEGYFAPPDPTKPFIRHPIDQTAWKQATNSSSDSALHLEVRIADATTVYGPFTEDWIVAPGVLKGTIYYSSYNTGLNTAAPNVAQAAAVLAIKVGQLTPTLAASSMQGKCMSCHTISPDGSTLFAQEGYKITVNAALDDDYDDGASYDLRNAGTVIQTYSGSNAAGTPRLGTAPDGSPNPRKFAWAALWHDGTFGVRGATDKWGFAQGTDIFGGNEPIYSIGLFRRDNGNALPATGLDGIDKIVTPEFSPDGKKIVFNYWAGTAAPGGGGGKTLDVMDVNCVAAINPAPGEPTCSQVDFSNLRRIYTHDGTNASDSYAGWAAWLPDSSAVVFHKKIASSNYWAGPLTTWRTATAEIWMSTVPDAAATQPDVVPLDQLDGLGYLPTGSGHPADSELNFEPTVNPIASGGYYWVLFTSRRMYGNVANGDPYDLGNGTAPVTKKLWVAAVDINPKPGQDPSHPAFYLPGQEINAPNMRGYWVVDPCKSLGTGCETGDECCDGYCRPPASGGTDLVCSGKPPGCANEFEACATSADCCGYLTDGSGYMCLNGHCARPQTILK